MIAVPHMLRHLLIFYSIYEFLAFIVTFEWRFFHKNCSESNNEQLLFYFCVIFCLFTEPVYRIPVHRHHLQRTFPMVYEIYSSIHKTFFGLFHSKNVDLSHFKKSVQIFQIALFSGF